jgi:hypothetical protein
LQIVDKDTISIAANTQGGEPSTHRGAHARRTNPRLADLARAVVDGANPTEIFSPASRRRTR